MWHLLKTGTFRYVQDIAHAIQIFQSGLSCDVVLKESWHNIHLPPFSVISNFMKFETCEIIIPEMCQVGFLIVMEFPMILKVSVMFLIALFF